VLFRSVDKTQKKLNLSLDEKFDLYQYQGSKSFDSWLKFEDQLVHYSAGHHFHELPDQSVSIWQCHPDYSMFDKNLVGPDDKVNKFYIDPSNNFEWVILNALYKNSYINSRGLIEGKKMLDDDSIIKIDLNKILESSTSLIDSVQQVLSECNIKLNNSNRKKIEDLREQWILTTLPRSKFQDFKNQIGYFNT
jgi:hypothetical protein